MTTEQAATLLNVSPATVRRLVYRGHLTPINPDNSILARPKLLLFRRADVERLAAQPPPRKPRTPRH